MPVLPDVASSRRLPVRSSPRASPSQDHPPGRPILDRATRIQPLRLGVQLDPVQLLVDGSQPQKWRVPNGMEDRLVLNPLRMAQGDIIYPTEEVQYITNRVRSAKGAVRSGRTAK